VGNKLGWAIAGIAVLAIGLFLVMYLVFPAATMPTFRSMGDNMVLPVPKVAIGTVIGAEPSEPGNAGEDYNQALAAFAQPEVKSLWQACVRANKVTDTDMETLKSVVNPLLAGTRKKNMQYYFKLTPQKIELPYQPTEQGDFQDLTDVLRLLAISAAQDNQYPKAEQYLFAYMIVGNHLFAERARYDISKRGLGFMKAACSYKSFGGMEGLVPLYEKWNKPDRVEAVKALKEALESVSARYDDLYQIIWMYQEKCELGWNPWPGDVFNLAENHPDRGVRVEAILSLGVIKLTDVNMRGDEKKCRRLIDAKLSSPDPIEREAARQANALDEAGLQKLAKAMLSTR
jgi:hypothetical protein